MRTIVCLNLIAFLVFLSPVAHAQTFSVIHTFTGNGGDGASPAAGVTLRAGALYGTTSQGGVGGATGPGTVYQMTHSGSGWTYTPVFLFPADKSGGANPQARVVFGPDGHLYGTTNVGGASQAGVVFYLTPPLSICKTVFCSWKENVLWNFGAGNDGAYPGYGDLIWDQWNDQGNIWNTTINGGTYNSGTLYELTKVGSVWAEQVQIAFNSQNYQYCPAAFPWSGATLIGSNVFGTGTTSILGGSVWGLEGSFLDYIAGFGQNNPHGAYPYAGLTADASDNFYGAASDGGANGGGTVFQLPPPYGQQLNLLYSFSGTPGRQCGPKANLTFDAAGNIYGTTVCDGANHFGNVFKLTKVGDTWVYTSVYDFTGGNDGANPISNVTIDTDGTLYGTTSSRGANNYGTVWMIKQ
jgi:uncharacterized repeat protein (TIGR03803 family)